MDITTIIQAGNAAKELGVIGILAVLCVIEAAIILKLYALREKDQKNMLRLARGKEPDHE